VTGAELAALAPLLALGAGITLLLLALAVRRSHGLAVGLTVATLAAAGVAALGERAPQGVTALLVLDAYSRLVIALVAAAGVAVALLLRAYLASWEGQREEMYLLLLLAVLGAATLAASRHAASLLVGLETLSIALFGMIAYPRESRRPLEAAIKYLVLSTAAAATLFFGLALLYAATGALEFERLGEAIAFLAPGPEATLVAVGAAMAWVGFGFKLSLVPFHLWTPDVYEGAPAPVTAFLAAVSKGAVAALLLRYVDRFPAAAVPGLAFGLTAVAVATIVLGNLLALLQTNVKRLLAYSSIAHVGYLLVPFLLGGELAREAVLVYLVAYTVMTLGSFGAVTLVSTPLGEGDLDRLADYRGLFWRRPWLAAAFASTLLAQAGVPLTVGFLAKFYVLAAGAGAGAWLLVGAVALGSALGLYYYLRLAFALFARDAAAPAPLPARAPGVAAGGLVLAVLVAALFWLGTLPAGLLDWIAPAAAALR
jgi:NADH-quinone oxidoreductase subunit N